MLDDKGNWKQLEKLNFDRKKVSKRAKKIEGATIRHAHKFILGRLDNIRSVRRNIIVWLLLVAVILVAVGVQFMWFKQSYQTTAAADGGTYAEASLGPIKTLNPLYAASSAELTASRLMFSSLYSYDTTGHLGADLAESMQVDASQTKYTVKVRSDARWHDGASVTAKDIAFTIELIKDPEALSPLRSNWKDVAVKVINDTTVQFSLPAVYASFPHALTFAVLPKHLLENVSPVELRENAFSKSPIGSGPFTFKLLQTTDPAKGDKAVHMTANEDYYRGKPKLGRFEVRAYTSQDDILAAVTMGEVSAATDVSTIDTDQLSAKQYNVISQPVKSGVYALMNNKSPVLKDKAIRKALQVGTDTQAIRNQLQGNVAPLDLPFVNGQIEITGLPKAPQVDTAKAMQMLDKADWKLQGDVRYKGKQQLELSIVTTKNVQYEKALETLVGQWRKLGIKINTEVVNTSDPSVNFARDTLQERRYEVLLYELIIGADPDIYAYWHSSQAGVGGYNFANYRDITADALLSSARSRLEPTLRNIKYRSFAEKWLADAPAIGLYQPTTRYIVNRNIHSIDSASALVTAQDRFSNVQYWSVSEAPVYKTP